MFGFCQFVSNKSHLFPPKKKHNVQWKKSLLMNILGSRSLLWPETPWEPSSPKAQGSVSEFPRLIQWWVLLESCPEVDRKLHWTNGKRWGALEMCHQPKLWQQKTSSKLFFLRMSFFFVSCFIGCVTVRTWFASLKIFATQLSGLFAIEWFRHDQSFFTGSLSWSQYKVTMKSIEIHCSFCESVAISSPFQLAKLVSSDQLLQGKGVVSTWLSDSTTLRDLAGGNGGLRFSCSKGMMGFFGIHIDHMMIYVVSHWECYASNSSNRFNLRHGTRMAWYFRLGISPRFFNLHGPGKVVGEELVVFKKGSPWLVV